jgi:serine/threonine protein kinase
MYCTVDFATVSLLISIHIVTLMSSSDGDDLFHFRKDIDPNSIYNLIALLGEGSYGAVYHAIVRDQQYMIDDLKEDNQHHEEDSQVDVAVKIIPDADNDLVSLGKEIKFLQLLKSPFVVSFIESLLYDNELWLVMELW